MNLAVCERIMDHLAAKIKSVGKPLTRGVSGDGSSRLQLSWIDHIGSAQVGRKCLREEHRLLLECNSSVIAGCNLSGLEGFRLETHSGKLLGFPKDFFQTLVCELAL